jgi:spore coat polysaccharide biosynthesis protein SpsF
MNIPYIMGSEEDVQGRIIQAADSVNGDIIYRVTTECPFIYMDNFSEVLDMHIQNQASLTVIEGLPEGAYYEIITTRDIKSAHNLGELRHRSELCTLYMMEHPEKFKLQRLKLPHRDLCRPDIRLTVDYPEDLIVVREIYKALNEKSKFINIIDIIRFLDQNPSLKDVNGWIGAGIGRIWN